MTGMRNILVIDDEASMRHMLCLVLEREGYRVTEVPTADEGLQRLGQETFDLLLCDIRMPGMDGLTFLGEMQRRGLSQTVVMMSAYGSIDTAVECLKAGAYDYISKPFKPDEVVLTLRKVEERRRLLEENRDLRRELGREGALDQLVFRSPQMAELVELVKRVAHSSSPALVTGETGTGKELVARALHYAGPRHDQPFIAVNCGAIAGSLMESELFGHAKGAFTGADKAREGYFQAAQGGTLFLDEIGEMPLELQPKLLRVIQESELRRVGETQLRRIDVRVVVATARDLLEEIAAGRFREDLFYRLAVVDLKIPPLRERREDVAVLAEHFLARIARRERRPVPRLSREARQSLENYRWPGNVRELENFLEKAMIFCRGDVLDVADLPWDVRRQDRDSGDHFSLKKAITRLEKEYIRKALADCSGNRTHAARRLEISYRALLYKIKEYDLE